MKRLNAGKSTEMVFERISRWVRNTFTEPDIDTRIEINLETDRKNLEADEKEQAETEYPERRVE
jgi:hypothetical protein